jgi:hypothetical protein
VGLISLFATAGDADEEGPSSISGLVIAEAQGNRGRGFAIVTITVANADGVPVEEPTIGRVDRYQNRVAFSVFVDTPGTYKVTATFKQDGVKVSGDEAELSKPVAVPAAQPQTEPSPFPSIGPPSSVIPGEFL